MVSLFPPEPHCGQLDTIFYFNGFSFSSRDSLSHKKGSGKLDHPVNITFWFPNEYQSLVSNFVFEKSSLYCSLLFSFRPTSGAAEDNSGAGQKGCWDHRQPGGGACLWRWSFELDFLTFQRRRVKNWQLYYLNLFKGDESERRTIQRQITFQHPVLSQF